MKKNAPYKIQSITELHRLFNLPKPTNPLISVIDFEQLKFDSNEIWSNFYYDFYCVAIKKGASGKFRYGQSHFDFDEGIMSFTKPGQIFSVTHPSDESWSGYMLIFKPEIIKFYELAKNIGNYGFFSYSINEALHLSDKEENIIIALMNQIKSELENNMDNFSQDLIVSHLDLLLNYAKRFHNRQFLTRSSLNNELLTKLEELMDKYLKTDAQLSGLPTVGFFAEKLNLSPNYLSDLLKNTTGRNAQAHIQDFIVERAKQLLSTTDLSIKEIAHGLGFEYSQSFSTMFKRNTLQTPMQYRASFC